MSETPENKNTADIKAYLKVAGLDDPGGSTPWCGAFLAFCMKSPRARHAHGGHARSGPR